MEHRRRLWLLALLVPYIALASAAGFWFVPSTIATVWRANYWGDLVFIIGMAATGIMGWRLRVRRGPLVSVVATMALAYATFLVAATFNLRGFEVCYEGCPPKPLRPWQAPEFRFFGQLVFQVAGFGSLGIILSGIMPTLLVDALRRRHRRDNAS